MAKLIYAVLFFSLIFSVISINEKCNDRIFILISSKTVLLYNFELPNDYSSGIIYEAKSDTTIEQGLFYKRTNTIILLVKHVNETYSILSLNTHDDIYSYWKEKSSDLIYAPPISLALGQRYLYLLNHPTMLLQIFTLPLTSTAYKEKNLLDLPNNRKILNYIVDERVQLLWILFDHHPYQLYLCQLKSSSCHLYINLYNLITPIQVAINWQYEQFYLYSHNYLMIFEYRQNQTNYSIHYLNSTQENQHQFFTICPTTNQIEYLTINYTTKRQVCYQTCQHLSLNPTDTSRIHTIQRLSTLSDILYCSKQRRIGNIIMIILIAIDLAIILAVILWLGYKYFYHTILDTHEKRTSTGTIWTIDKESVTYF